MATIAVVIVNYNTREVLRQCLASIDHPDATEVIVVDNASTDGSVEMVSSCFPQVKLLANAENSGYGAGANRGIASCSADYVLLLNSDTVLQHGCAAALRAYLDLHSQVAVVGPRLHNPDGTLQASCYPFPTPVNLFLQESLLGRLAARVPGLRDQYLRTWRHDKVKAVPWVLGAALAMRRNAFMAEAGFDPEFFMYFEEIDLCYRLRAADWEVHFAPVTTVIHTGGVSTGQQPAKMQVRLFESMKLFYARHYAPWQMRLLYLVLMPIYSARLIHDALRYSCSHDQRKCKDRLEIRRAWYCILQECLFQAPN